VPDSVSDGVYLRAIADTPGFDPVRTWGPGPLLLIKAAAPGARAPVQFNTPSSPMSRQIALASTSSAMGTPEDFQDGYLGENSVVVPIRKTKRNPWSHITLGRARVNDIRLSDKSVSKVHCYIYPPAAWEVIQTAEPWRIRDCGSTNGSFVLLGSGPQAIPAKDPGFQLVSGTELLLGQVLALFVDAQDLVQSVEFARSQWELADREAAKLGSGDTDHVPRPFPVAENDTPSEDTENDRGDLL
jgi:hypothetical protein